MTEPSANQILINLVSGTQLRAIPTALSQSMSFPLDTFR